MEPAPHKIGITEVIFFATIDKRSVWTGNTRHIVDSVTQGPAAGLAICQCKNEDGYYLFGCDSNWDPVTDTWHETIEKAKSQAEFEYAGVSQTWQSHAPPR